MPVLSHDDHGVETTLAYRRSLRQSRARRAQAVIRRRRIVRSRGTALLAGGLLVLGAGGAMAQTGGMSAGSSKSGETKRSSATAHASAATIRAVQRKLDLKVDGVVGPKTRSAIRRFQRRNDLEVDGRIGPATLKAMGIRARSDRRQRGGASAQLEKIAECESGGDPTAVSKSGQYRGKYQFDRPTWESVGGEGDPAEASEDEQDRRAAMLMEKQGPSAWPNCA